jgi:ubiquitin-large subunit ribosomal protein L40e
MRLYVRIANTGSTLTIDDLSADSTIAALRGRIEAVENLPENSGLIIVHAGRECLDETTIAGNSLVHLSTLHVVFRNPVDDRALRCGVCFETYEADGLHVPHVLPCGHSLCGSCISHLNPRECPFDRSVLPFNDFPRNFTIIGLLGSSGAPSESMCVDCMPRAANLTTPHPRPAGVQGRIQVFIKTLTGLTIAFDVASSDTVRTLKQKISDRQGVPVSQQRLVFSAKQLADDKTMSDYGIRDSSTIHLIMRMLGG